MSRRRAWLAVPALLIAACTAEQLSDPRASLADYWRSRRGTPLEDGTYEYDLPGGRVRAMQRGFTTVVEVAPAGGGFDRAVAEGIFLEDELTPASRDLLRATGNPRLVEIAGLRSREFLRPD